MSSGMMDTAPGGESTQYESINTATQPASKQGGQMGDPETQSASTASQTTQHVAEKGTNTAENTRYGQNISESGMGGTTAGVSGRGNQGGFGGTESMQGTGDDDAAETRRDQGYGAGSGVGG